MPLVEARESGLYCAAGDFWIDPWKPVERAVVTHAHSDHAAEGSAAYLTSRDGAAVLRTRLSADARIEAAEYGAELMLGEARVSLHPAGHILGSSQVRIESRGEVWVISGDYKTVPDPTCAAFEPLRCHTFVTESTFGLPIFRWPDERAVFAAIGEWWRGNRAAGRASVLFAYPLGKAQRVLARVDASIGPVYTHGAVERMNAVYRAHGVLLAPTSLAAAAPPRTDWSAALIVAPPGLEGSPWMRRFGPVSTALASGWMRIRGTRRRRALDRGFVLSDHADWDELQRTVDETGASLVWTTHGFREPFAHWLREHGREAHAVQTAWEGEREEPVEEEPTS